MSFRRPQKAIMNLFLKKLILFNPILSCAAEHLMFADSSYLLIVSKVRGPMKDVITIKTPFGLTIAIPLLDFIAMI